MAFKFNPYASVRRTEPSMRDEMINTLDGFYPEIAKGQPAILRKMRRDSLGKLQRCDCVDAVTHEPDKDTFCPFCQGEGYYWDENYIEMYKVRFTIGQGHGSLNEELTTPGLINVPLMVFYTRSSVDFTIDDKIVQLVLDEAGGIVQPPRRQALFRIGALLDYRSDGGRLEFWKVACYGESRKFLNGPNI